MSAITIGEDLIHYEKLGRGRPLILVHGWIGSWRYWIPVMQHLHLKYTVYTIDMVGFGDSAKNPMGYSIESRVATLRAFTDTLGIPKVALIGHGLGALICAYYALRYPEQVARMFLTSVPLFDPGDLESRTPPGQRMLLTRRDRYSLAPNMPQEADEADDDRTIANQPGNGVMQADVTLPRRPAFHELPTVGRVDADNRQRIMEQARNMAIQSANQRNQLREAFDGKSLIDLLGRCFKKSEPEYDKLKVDVDKADERVLPASFDGYEAGEFLDVLRRVTSPTVIAHGENDPILPVPETPIWNYLTKDKEDVCVPVPLPDVRHFPMLEHESFPRLLTDFLETVDLSTLEIRKIWRRPHR